MAAKKKTEEATGLHGYPVTEFRGPAGEKATVTSAVMEHNLRAAGFVPTDPKKAPTQADLSAAAEKADDTPAPTPATETQTSR